MNSSKSSHSLAALVSHPIQYQAPLFRTIDQLDHIDLSVYFCSGRGVEPAVDPGFGEEIVWDRQLLEGYEYTFLNNWRSGAADDPIGDVNPGIVSELKKRGHDALWIHGYTSVTNWLGLIAANALNIPVILRGESTLIDRPPAYVRAPKQAMIRSLTKLVDAYGVIGSHNRDFYRAFGVPEKELFHAPYTVDNAYFQRIDDELPPQSELRAEIGMPNRPTLLFVGKLIERKRPRVLLEAFVEAVPPGEANLVFVGDGDRRTTLERLTNELGREDDVRFAGFKNQSELPKFYAASDLFVLPSAQENWGLVINEAMNFELPIITTDAVGAAADLVTEQNGGVVPVDDGQALSDSIRTTLSDHDLEEMGSVSREVIDDWGIEETAAGIAEAIEYVV